MCLKNTALASALGVDAQIMHELGLSREKKVFNGSLSRPKTIRAVIFLWLGAPKYEADQDLCEAC